MSQCTKCGECEAEICQDCYEVRVERTPLEKAAPDLLEACKEICGRLNYRGNFGMAGDPVVKQALMEHLKNVIAKAQGNQ